MITYAERVCFRPMQLLALARVEACVGRISDHWGNELRCHELVRAVYEVIDDRDLLVVDGKCGPIEHSWLCFTDGMILDPYTPGRLPAIQLVDPIAGSYRPGEMRSDIKQPVIDQLICEMLSRTSSRPLKDHSSACND